MNNEVNHAANYMDKITPNSIKENEGYRRADEIIKALFPKIDEKKFQESTMLLSGWKKIVSTISTDPKERAEKKEQNKTGLLLASHSDVVDLKNGILLVETDHPAYIQMMMMYKDYILKGLKKNYPELNIKSVCYKLKNTDVKLKDFSSNSDETSKEINENKKTKEKIDFQVDKNLPSGLQNIFEKMKDSLED